MPINRFLIGSITGAVLANPAVQPLATFTERPPLMEHRRASTSDEYLPPSVVLPSSKASEAGWQNVLAANARSLSELRAGWDGPGSIAISKAVLSQAVFYVETALKPATDLIAPRLVPGGDGSVQIEWHTAKGELEFDIGRFGELSIWIRDHSSGAEFDGEAEKALVLFYRWARWVASSQRDVPDLLPASPMADFAIAA